jgi:hypothetical protein
MEFDAADVLLADVRSHLSTLVEQTGPIEAEHLRRLANMKRSVRKTRTETNIEIDASTIDSNETDPLLVHKDVTS